MKLRQILPGSEFRTAAAPTAKPSIVRISPADILTIEGQIRKTFHILIPRWHLTAGKTRLRRSCNPRTPVRRNPESQQAEAYSRTPAERDSVIVRRVLTAVATLIIPPATPSRICCRRGLWDR